MSEQPPVSRYRGLPQKASKPIPNRALVELETTYRAYRWERTGLLSGLSLIIILGLSTGIGFLVLDRPASVPAVAAPPPATPPPAAASTTAPTAMAQSQPASIEDPAPSLAASPGSRGTSITAPDTAAAPPPRVPLSAAELAAAHQRWDHLEAEHRRLDSRADVLRRQWPVLREELESQPFLDLTAPIHLQYEDATEVRPLAEICDDLDRFAETEFTRAKPAPDWDAAPTLEEVTDALAAAETALASRRHQLDEATTLFAGALQAAPMETAGATEEESQATGQSIAAAEPVAAAPVAAEIESGVAVASFEDPLPDLSEPTPMPEPDLELERAVAAADPEAAGIPRPSADTAPESPAPGESIASTGDTPAPDPAFRGTTSSTDLQLPPELAFLRRLEAVPGFDYTSHMQRFSGDGLIFTFEVLEPPYVFEIPLFAYDRWRDLLAELDRKDLVTKAERRQAESLLGYQRFAMALPALQRAGLYVDPTVDFDRVRVTEAAGLR